MPPQNMPLWHKDYFELKAIEKEQDIRVQKGPQLPSLPGRTES